MSSFDNLPDEQLILVALDLPLDEIGTYSRLSKRFSRLVSNNNDFWYQRFVQDYPEVIDEVPYEESWKTTYDTQVKREQIYKVIVKSMREYDFERGIDIGDGEKALGFASYEEFKKGQMKALISSDKEDIDFYYILADRIGWILIMDKESMVPFTTDGFCFNRKGKFIITNAR